MKIWHSGGSMNMRQNFGNWDHQELAGKNLTTVLPQIDGTDFYNILSKALAKKINISREVIDPVTHHWLNLSATPYADGLIVIFYDIQHEKETEQRLKKSIVNYHSLVENVPDVITQWNKELKLIYANLAFGEKAGVSNESLYGKNSSEMGQPDEIAVPYMNSLRKAFVTGQPAEYFNSFATPQGELLFYSRIVPEKNEKGEVLTVLGIAKDVTELKKAETERERAYVILNTMNSACYELNADGIVIFANKKVKDLFDISTQKILGKNFWDIFPDAEEPGCFEAIQVSALDNKRYAQHEYASTVLHKWILLTATPAMNGCIVLFTETDELKSVTQENLRLKEERQAEHALGQSEEKLRELNASLELQVSVITADLVKQQNILKQAEEIAQAGTWEYNVKTKEFLWSDGMYRLFEMKKDEHVSPGAYLKYSLEDDLPVAKKIIDSIEKKFESFEEIMRIKFDGSYKTLRIKAAPLKNEKGGIEKMLGVDLDISQMQQSEEKIRELNRSLSATNRELHSLNTELKTFTTIAANNYSETLRHLYINLEMIVTNDARNLSNSGRANLRRAQGAIQKMKLVTDDLISFSRLHEIGAKENNVDLNIILEKVTEDFRKQPVNSLITINCDHLPLVSGYPLLLSLLFHHLMDNAIKFRKRDHDHIVKVTCKESVNGNDIVHNAVEKNVKYHIISVEDNGIGFPQTESEKIFEMFSRLNEKGKYKGSGTGLALCKKIMEMHGGFIAVEGIPDERCFFSLLFSGVIKSFLIF